MKKVLYFVRGGAPSPEQALEAKEMRALIRNANITANDFIERCDGVAGEVPEAYRHYPTVGSSVASATVPDKPLGEMSNKELDAKAQELGITFPREVNNKAEKAAFIADHLASAGDGGA